MSQLGCVPIRVFTAQQDGLDPSQFVQLTLPANSNHYLIRNLGPDRLYMRSDKDDPSTEDYIESGASEAFIGAPLLPGSDQHRFNKGCILYWVKCTGPLVGKFW